jgi:two-component system, chemotaxis family, CheB/CheR fusion protein
MIDITVRDGLPFPVVGVGASADDADGLRRFFDNTAIDSGMAFIVMQPTVQDQQSATLDLLSQHTAMPVHMLADGTSLQPNHVYVMQPVRRELD